MSAVGNANNDILQDAATIERLIRRDLERVSDDGIFAIRSVAVRNDVNFAAGGPLLNPQLPPWGIVRSDQLVFFATGIETARVIAPGSDTNTRAQALVSRIYYGHAFQLTEGEAYNASNRAHDPDLDLDDPLTPWYFGQTDMVRTLYNPNSDFTPFTTATGGTIAAVQPEARQWLFVRQPVLLVDDDNSTGSQDTVFSTFSDSWYTIRHISSPSIFLQDWELPANRLYPHIRNGRVDAAATELNDIRRIVATTLDGDTPIVRPWSVAPAQSSEAPFEGDQRMVIRQQMIYYPRAERFPPSSDRVDQALSNHILGSACSSFIVEWTYDEGVGSVLDENGLVDWQPGYNGQDDHGGGDDFGAGFRVDSGPQGPDHLSVHEHPWFGMPDPYGLLATDPLTGQSTGAPEMRPDPARGVGAFGDPEHALQAKYRLPMTILPTEPVGMLDPDTAGDEPSAGEIHTPNNIESIDLRTDRVAAYEAFFGFQRDRQTLDDPAYASLPPTEYLNPSKRVGYTPRPSALRITMTLHDVRTNLESGRTFQFVVRLPNPEKTR